MARGYWAYITPVSRPGGGGGPVDPGWGIEEGVDPGYGVDEGGHPDQGLPGGGRPPHVGNRPPGSWEPPVHPGQGLPHPGRPVDPGYGVDEGDHIWPRPPGGRPGRPGHLPARPPHTWPRPPGGGLPVDPGWGQGGRPGFGERPDHGLPIWPIVPGKPDQGLPPIDGEEPPTDPPPGTIWPPIPPEVNIPEGKAIALVAISGLGYRYAVITIPPHAPDQGLPGGGEGEQPETPPQPTPTSAVRRPR
jgi:hypothetical protein